MVVDFTTGRLVTNVSIRELEDQVQITSVNGVVHLYCDLVCLTLYNSYFHVFLGGPGMKHELNSRQVLRKTTDLCHYSVKDSIL